MAKDTEHQLTSKSTPVVLQGKGESTGMMGKSLLNGKKPLMGFPLKGRKPFVPPQKVSRADDEGEEEQQPAYHQRYTSAPPRRDPDEEKREQ